MGIHERKEREKEQRREEILNAAQKIFFEKDLQASTMDEIAEAAELSKGTLYLYYKSKEDLYLAVMMRGIETLHTMFCAVISVKRPIAVRLAMLGEAYFQFFLKYRNYFRMFYFFQNPQFHKQVSPEIMEACTMANQKLWQLVIGLIQKGIEEGSLRPNLQPAEAAVMLWSSSNAIMTRMDTQGEYFKSVMKVDLEQTLQQSNILLLESMLTDKAKPVYRAFINENPMMQFHKN
ncbi:MAG: TetR/AcrR family transcriptional regulator [Ignavibacteriales bacterium]|nr:TetR/AcrR family transcriptional regulator [Ignavibacteriales bacterium]